MQSYVAYVNVFQVLNNANSFCAGRILSKREMLTIGSRERARARLFCSCLLLTLAAPLPLWPLGAFIHFLFIVRLSAEARLAAADLIPYFARRLGDCVRFWGEYELCASERTGPGIVV